MALSKIQSIVPSNPATWVSSRGTTMYAYDVTLEDGEMGGVNTMKPNRWNVGDEVDYEQRQTNMGSKLQLSKPNFQQPHQMQSSTPFSSQTKDDTTKGIIASWAVGVAVNSLGDCKAEKDHYWRLVAEHAKKALETRKELMNEVE